MKRVTLIYLAVAIFIFLACYMLVTPDNKESIASTAIAPVFSCTSEENSLTDWKVASVSTDSPVVLITSDTQRNTRIVAHVENGAELSVGDPVVLTGNVCADGLGAINANRIYATVTLRK